DPGISGGAMAADAGRRGGSLLRCVGWTGFRLEFRGPPTNVLELEVNREQPNGVHRGDRNPIWSCASRLHNDVVGLHGQELGGKSSPADPDLDAVSTLQLGQG